MTRGVRDESRRIVLQAISSLGISAAAVSTVEAADGENATPFSELSDTARQVFLEGLQRGTYEDDDRFPAELYENRVIQYQGVRYALNLEINHQPENRFSLAELPTDEIPEGADVHSFDELSPAKRGFVTRLLAERSLVLQGEDMWPLTFSEEFLRKDGLVYRVSLLHLDRQTNVIAPRELEGRG